MMKRAGSFAIGVGLILLVMVSMAFAQTYTADQILNNMNQSGKDFPYMEASMEQTKIYTLPGVEPDKETGKIYLGRQGKSPLIKIDWDGPPASKTLVLVKDGQFSQYYPGRNKVELYKAGDKAEFFMILFGQGSDNFKKNFEMTVGKTEVVDGQNTIILDLKPKSSEVAKRFTLFRLWIDTKRWITIQTRASHLGGEATIMLLKTVTRAPSVKTAVFDLKMPKDVNKIPLG